jgi:hypothetical protein
MLECKATLRFKSESLSLNEISNVLGEPTKGFSIGQEFGKAKRKRPHSQWELITVEDESSFMQGYINELLEFYLEKDLSRIKAKCDVDIFCMLSSDNGQGSFTLNNEIYDKLVDAGLSITFDFYSD